MKAFKDAKYDDFSGEVYKGDIIVDTGIESLVGSPEIVKGNFSCISCPKLTSLKGAPEIVDGTFDCNSCKLLKSLEGAPKIINYGVYCSFCNNLETLKGSPEIVGGGFNCAFCPKLKDLKGSPKVLDGGFVCTYCENLETLEGAPKKCRKFYCRGCPKLTTLDPLLKCDIEEVEADEHLLEDYYKKKAIIEKHGFDNAMEVLEMITSLEN